MRKILLVIMFWAFVISANAQNDTITCESGLKYVVVNKGDGEMAQDGKEVALHGIGYFTNGEIFWETRESNDPFYFTLGTNSVIKGCEEGVGKMRVGDRWILVMPPEIAYGDRDRDPIPPNSTLIFDYEILSVSDPKASIKDTLYSVIGTLGIDEALDLYNDLKSNKPDEFCFRIDQLNGLGYKLIKDKKYKEALAVFEVNAKAYPENYNVWDSLGEIYMLLEDNEKAIKYYKKSLEIYPKNTNAEKTIKKLEGNQ